MTPTSKHLPPERTPASLRGNGRTAGMAPTRQLYETVNAADTGQVAELLGLTPARERHKYGCPECGSRDNLHAYTTGGRHGGGFYCWGGGCGPKGAGHFSNVDLAAYVWGVEPRDACVRLADALGILVPDRTPRWTGVHKAATHAPRRPLASTAETPATEAGSEPTQFAAELEALRADGYVPAERSAIHRVVLDCLTVEERGAAYLRGRGLDPEAAATYGFRSLAGPYAWRELGELLGDSYLPVELAGTGFWRPGEDGGALRYAPPWGGRAPALLIPYLHHGTVLGLRFRNLQDGMPSGNRYRMLGASPALPFHADALDGLGTDDELHVLEGELDCWTAVTVRSWRAVGLPGTSAPRAMLDALVSAARPVRKLVVWYDADEAGARAFDRLRDRVQATHGGTWVQKRMVCAQPRHGKDLNELHQQGAL